MDKQRKMAILSLIIIIPIISIILWSNDQPVETNLDESKINILVSFYPIEEFTKKVGKDKINISVMVDPGVEPHDWEPKIKDIQRMQKADMIIINGLGIENWAKDIYTINPNANVIDTSFGITPIYINLESRIGGDKLRTDPHIWLNPITIKIQVQNIADALIELDYSNREFYQKNADAYKLELDAMDEKIRDELAQCSKKDFFAFHSAFAYFADQYGLNQHTVLKSIDPMSDPSPQDIMDVIVLAKTLNTSVIFTEEGVNPRMSQIIADEVNSIVLVLSPLEFGDDEKNYLERMEQNLDNLKIALCDSN